jgi:predicted RNase H-like HicB family nuclease
MPARTAARSVGDYLRIPYLVTAQSREEPDGSWTRHVEHPELPECSAEATSITDALALLDQRRIQVVIAMLSRGETPPTARAPIGERQGLDRVRRAGLADRVAVLWNRDAAELAAGRAR